MISLALVVTIACITTQVISAITPEEANALCHISSSLNPSPWDCSIILNTCNVIIKGLVCLNGKLYQIDLGGQNTYGTISTYIGQLSSVRVLSVHGNMISGTIPSQISQMSSLSMLIIKDTIMNGTIPHALYTLPLTDIIISNTNIGGTLNNLVQNSISNVQLNNNRLSGTLPNIPTSVKYLDLSFNKFSGTIPLNYSLVTTIILSFNQLSGTIPSTFPNAKTFRVSNNLLSGTIPLLGSIDVNEVDLSFNKFDDYSLISTSYNIRNSDNLVVNLVANRFNDSFEPAMYFSRVKSILSFPQDINECDVGRYVCPLNAYCYDGWSPSLSYTCRCVDGFIMSTECVDVNECDNGQWSILKSNNTNKSCNSQEECVNTIGSFNCCKKGFRRSVDGNECVDINECVDKTSTCGDGMCVNTVGSYYCCSDGQFNPDLLKDESICEECYTNTTPTKDVTAMYGIELYGNYLSCFGQCNDGRRYTYSIPSTKCKSNTLIYQEPCVYPCMNLSWLDSPQSAVTSLYNEFIKERFIYDLFYQRYGLVINISLYPNNITIYKHGGAKRSFEREDVNELTELILRIVPNIPSLVVDVDSDSITISSSLNVNSQLYLYSLLCIIPLCIVVIVAAYYISLNNSYINLLPKEVSHVYRMYYEGLGRLTWGTVEGEDAKYHYKYINKDNELFYDLIHIVDGDEFASTVKCITLVCNETLISNFVNAYRIQKERVKSNPSIFKKMKWDKSGPSHNIQQAIYQKYMSLANDYTWNVGEDVPILPVCHGTNTANADKICMSGFASLSSLDSGWYGKGIYFSTYPQYCIEYSASSRKDPCIIVSWMLPGNTYPVYERHDAKENIVGTSLKSGYQSHFVVVNKKGEMELNGQYNEFVVAQEAQICPAFILHL